MVHNVPVYKKLGLRKRYFSPLSSKDFKNMQPAIEKENSTDLKDTSIFKNADADSKQYILDFEKEGFIILKQFLSSDQVATINTEIDNLLRSKKIKFGHGNKIMFAIHRSELLISLGNDPKLLELLSV